MTELARNAIIVIPIDWIATADVRPRSWQCQPNRSLPASTRSLTSALRYKYS
jgi:hypothetical protein